jgi:hypothetical protein
MDVGSLSKEEIWWGMDGEKMQEGRKSFLNGY